jgi:hypothetical protein
MGHSGEYEGGLLDEVTWYNRMENYDCPDDEANTGESYWSMASTSHGAGDENTYDCIEESKSAWWRFNMAFDNRPENLANEECSYWNDQSRENNDFRPYPVNFQYTVELGDDESHTDGNKGIELEDPYPKEGHGEGDHKDMEAFLDIVATAAGAVGGAYAGVGGSLIKYIIAESTSSNGASHSSDSNNSIHEWDVPLSGDYDDFPYLNDSDHNDDGENDAVSAEVQCQVRNEYSSGTHNLKVDQSFSFNYYKAVGDCQDCHPDTITKKTAPGLLQYPEYDAECN